MDAWNHWFKKLLPGMQSGEDNDSAVPKKRTNHVILLIVLGVFLLLVSRLDVQRPGDTTVQNAGLQLPRTIKPDERYESDLESRLERWLSNMQGVGSVEVFITLDRTEQYEYAVERTQERSHTEEPSEGGAKLRTRVEERITERPILTREDQGRTETPVLITTYSPTIRGVVVLADGAYDPRIRYQIIQAVQTALGVPAHRVDVLTKKE